jgi:uncharacterized iron-regulated protein
MITLAATHARSAELREKAEALAKATDGFFGKPQTHTAKQFLGAWARARRLWCDCTGEPLV